MYSSCYHPKRKLRLTFGKTDCAAFSLLEAAHFVFGFSTLSRSTGRPCCLRLPVLRRLRWITISDRSVTAESRLDFWFTYYDEGPDPHRYSHQETARRKRNYDENRGDASQLLKISDHRNFFLPTFAAVLPEVQPFITSNRCIDFSAAELLKRG